MTNTQPKTTEMTNERKTQLSEVSKALYVFNKEAKRIRDERKSIIDFIYEGDCLPSTMASIKESLTFTDVNVDVIYHANFSEISGEYAQSQLTELSDRCYAFDSDSREYESECQEEESLMDFESLKFEEAREAFEDLHSKLRDGKYKIEELYETKQEAIYTLISEKLIEVKEFHKFPDCIRPYYVIAGIGFHGERIEDEEKVIVSSEILELISSKIDDDKSEGMNIEKATQILENLLSR